MSKNKMLKIIAEKTIYENDKMLKIISEANYENDKMLKGQQG